MPKPKWLEPLEQFGHFWMGFGCGLTFLRLVLWWREFKKQWPPGDPLWVDKITLTVSPHAFMGAKQYYESDRVWDLAIDELFYNIGYTAGQLTQIGLTVWLTMKYF